VTGGSAGIGYYAALALARAGARVHIAGATAEHGEAAEREMNEYLQENRLQGAVTWHEVDLGDLKATDALAQKIAKESRLDILICNAGASPCILEVCW
jgi:NAD(P)-dependent dehydrogenase (short-subunit alcohol dehydrogenase family)